MSTRDLGTWIRAGLAGSVFALTICACQPQPSGQRNVQERAVEDARWPAFDYRSNAVSEHGIFRLDPSRTRIDIVVRRDGPLARFGHDHVIAVRDPEGYLLLDEAGTAIRADLRFLLDRLEIDAEAARQRYGLDTEPSESDIDGTRSNLMGQVLNPERWPWVNLELTEFARPGEHSSATVSIRINGANYNASLPFHLRPIDSGILVEGDLRIRQTDLGIEPFSTLGGGLRVADPLEIHFRIAGVPLNAGAP